MVRRILVLLSLFAGIGSAYSQKTNIYTEPDRDYRAGLELLEKQKYGSARSVFENVMRSPGPVSEEARSNSAYYAGRCAAELFHADAEFLLLDYINRYPESPLTADAAYTLATYYYRLKKYKKASEQYAKVVIAALPADKRDEANFRAGYCAYMSDDYDAASRYFYAVKDGESKYATSAQYFYAHMSFVHENYETALKEFLKLRSSEAFGPVVPYYITQIYYRQGRYDDVIGYAVPMLDSAGTRNGLEIGRIIGESYYKKGAYDKALPYLTDYERNGPGSVPADYYQIAYCNFRLSQYEAAIPYFRKVTDTEDSVAQNAYYHLAGCHLKIKEKDKARTAFQAAAKSDFNPFIAEESRYNYAKLSYDLSYQSEALSACRDFLKAYPNSSHTNDVNEILIAIYTSTRNYKDAMAALEGMKNKTPGMKAAYQKVSYFRGVELFMDRKTEEAIRLFRQSLSCPEDQVLVAKAHYWIGDSEYRLGHFSRSAAEYKEFLNTPAAVNLSTYNLGQYNLGYSLFKLEKHAEALTAFRKYVKAKDETDADRYADALLRIADCYFMQRDQIAAMEYYDQAVAMDAKASDYALYQKGVILGVRGRFAEKAATLEKLTAQYTSSVYMDDALYETGQAYLTIGKNAKASACFRRVIEEYPKSGYVRKAELGEALVYYNDNKDDEAAAACKKIIKNYPGTSEAKEALLQLKNISVARHQVDDYLQFVKDVPNAEVSVGAEDSLVYEAAEVLYTQGKCEDAVRDFDRYLDRFPSAHYAVNANYYRSDCLYRSGQPEAALSGFDFVLSRPRSQFTEKSLVNAATIRLKIGRYEEAAARFEELERTAEMKENVAAARIGLLRCYDHAGDCARSLSAASKIIDDANMQSEIRNEAVLISARCKLAAGDLKAAKELFADLAKRTNSEITAESRYSLALIEYKLTNYKESQRLALEVQNQVPSYDFWVAKSFILLGDDYLALRDTFQAKATFKSIIDNFQPAQEDPEDLKALALSKYEDIVAGERSAAGEELRRRRSALPTDSLEVNPIK
ncbi:MAG: hypothetical protein RL213_1549 [Bacteroidota bacterium]|jgi:TolA-binding protein